MVVGSRSLECLLAEEVVVIFIESFVDFTI